MEEKSAEIVRRVKLAGITRFLLLFKGSRSRSELVATFMAVLELLKAGRVHLTDDDTELVFAGREKKKAES